MASDLGEELGAEEPRGDPARDGHKRGSAANRCTRFSNTPPAESPETSPDGESSPQGDRDDTRSMRGYSVASEPKERRATSSARKPTVLLGSDGRPLSILKGNRPFDYGQARRLSEQLRVKFAVDRNETRFYCPDTNEYKLPPPAPSELRSSVRGFLKTSKRAVQESQEAVMQAQQRVSEFQALQEQLEVMTQQYVGKLERQQEQQRAKAAHQTIVITQPAQPQRRRLCCGGAPAVLP
ncbi:hypothetical protein ACSSS7_001570 [Eimeria intestinalis]